MAVTSLRLPEDVRLRLDALSERTGRSRNYHIVEAIKNYLDDLEDIYMAEQCMEDIIIGHDRFICSKEVEALLNKVDD